MQFREATSADAEAIARLHAESWRNSYRGIYSDAYLDGDICAERVGVWTRQLVRPRADQHTVLAVEGGALLGFVHTLFDEDPTWGALVDNLHVAAGSQRRGLGRRLMAESAAATIAARPARGLYLWVLEANGRARAFYAACGGQEIEHAPDVAPDGTSVAGIRVAWSDPSVLLVT